MTTPAIAMFSPLTNLTKDQQKCMDGHEYNKNQVLILPHCDTYCASISMSDYSEQCKLNALDFIRKTRKEIIQDSWGVNDLLIYGSIVVMLYLGYFIWWNSKLNQHPYKLYALEILTRVGALMRRDVCRHLILFPEFLIKIKPGYLMRLIRGDNARVIDDKSAADVIQSSIQNSHLQSILWRQAYFFANMILYLDLYLIIKQPFKPQAVRVRYYIIALFI